jgi:hypothetical protein
MTTTNTIAALATRIVVAIESIYLGDGDWNYSAVVVGENGYESVGLGWDSQGAVVNASASEIAAYAAHKAAQHEAWYAARLAREAQIEAENAAQRVVRGKLVIVARGRKVAKGTVGVVAWIGDSDWGTRVGLVIPGVDGLTYTAIGNLDVIEGPVPAPEARKPASVAQATVAALASIGGIPATWARLRDASWGVRVTREVKVGDVVTVTSQSGKVADKAITGIAFQGQGYTLCYV